MVMQKFLLIFVLAFGSGPLLADSYLILFQDSPADTKSSHKQNMEQKKNSNQQSIDKLFASLGVSKAGIPYQDLWLVSGMELNIKPEEKAQIEALSFVAKVLPNKTRQWLNPSAIKTRQEPDPQWGLNRLAIPKIRSQYPSIDGQGVRVGIIDTGIQSRHPEFDKKNKIVFKDFVNRIRSPYDDNGHGTHVAGTIAGAKTGVAPRVDIFAAKAFSATGSASDSWLLMAMQWLYDPDGNPDTADYPHVINNSWGLDLPFDIIDRSEFEPFHRALVAWVKSDIIPVFAAGNSGTSPNGMPGGFAEVLAIGAIDSQSEVAEFSSRGPNYWRFGKDLVNLFKPDFSAPGVDIYSAWPGNAYAYLSGTSMATPHATGSIALILQKSGRMSFADLKSLLLYSMEPKFDFNFGSGIISPLTALEMLHSETQKQRALPAL